MPGENIQDWSPTAAANANSDTLINWAEGQPRASVNNSARSMMAAHAKDRDLKNGSIITSGTANNQTFMSGVNYTIMPTGLRALLKIGPTLTNSGSVTLNMDGIADIVVTNLYGAALTGGELVAGSYYEFLYNGTNWIAISSPSALTLISAQTASAATQVNFTNLFSGNYTHYIFDCVYTPSADDSFVGVHVSTDNAASWVTSNYLWSYAFVSLATPPGSFNAASGQPNLQLTPTIPTGGFAQYSIMDLMVGGYQSFRTFGYGGAIGNYQFIGSGLPSGGIVVNAIRFFSYPGTISGTFKMYGVRA